MDARELRIGNLLKDKAGKVFGVENVSEYGLNGYSWSDTYYGTQSGGHEFTYNLEDVSPIPLTEEWLTKFGFNKDGDTKDLLFDYAICLERRINDLFLVQVDWPHKKKEIKYVHQLQNLFFALTGQELKLHENKNPDFLTSL